MELRSLKERITAEHGLLLLFIIVGTYMFVESYSFPDRPAAFPRFTAAMTVIGALALVFRSYLPGPLKRLVTDSGGAFEDMGTDDETPGEVDGDEKTSVSEPETRYVDLKYVTVHGALFVGILTSLFVALSYAIGMLWASPIFIAAYLIGLRRPWYMIVLLSVLGFLMAYGFVAVLNINIDSGALVDLGAYI